MRYFVLLSAFLSRAVFATTYTVPAQYNGDTQFPDTCGSSLENVCCEAVTNICHSLRAAIAKTNGGGQNVILLDAATYTLSLAGPDEDQTLTGDLDILASDQGLLIQGQGADLTIIDGGKLDRVFDLLGTDAPAEPIVFRNLTIRNGYVPTEQGGAVRATRNVVFENCIIGDAGKPNIAQSGGGLLVELTTASFTNTQVVYNQAVGTGSLGAGGGGGFLVSENAQVTFAGGAISFNSAFGAGAFWVNDTSAVSLTDVALNSNNVTGIDNNPTHDGSEEDAPFGGAIVSSEGALVFGENLQLDSNASASQGGAVGVTNDGEFNCDQCSFTNSQADWGGAFFAANGSTIELSDSLVANNTASVAAISYVYNTGLFNLDNVTLTNNTTTTAGSASIYALYGGGGTASNVTFSGNSGPAFRLSTGGLYSAKNSIFSGNGTNCILDDIQLGGATGLPVGVFTSLGYNLFDDASCTAAASDTVGDPQLGPLADNGGPTQTLLPGPAAIAAGNPAGCTDENGEPLATDQRGEPRPAGSACDIGAVEVQNTAVALTVTVAPSTPIGGGDATYTFVVTNSGPSDATGVLLTDTLPSGATFVTALSQSGSCVANAGVVTCSIGSLANGDSVSILVVAAIASGGAAAGTATLSTSSIDTSKAVSVALAAIAAAPVAVAPTTPTAPIPVTTTPATSAKKSGCRSLGENEALVFAGGLWLLAMRRRRLAKRR